MIPSSDKILSSEIISIALSVNPSPLPVDPEWRYTNLRYFNVVGSGTDELYDTSPHNLFPIVFDALLAGRTPRIFGDDYPTPDGTCVRDYVHVADLGRQIGRASCRERV